MDAAQQAALWACVSNRLGLLGDARSVSNEHITSAIDYCDWEMPGADPSRGTTTGATANPRLPADPRSSASAPKAQPAADGVQAGPMRLEQRDNRVLLSADAVFEGDVRVPRGAEIVAVAGEPVRGLTLQQVVAKMGGFASFRLMLRLPDGRELTVLIQM